jgi:hypothetical protein
LTQDDGYVERTFTVATANWTRIGVTLGHGRKGLFAYITRADGVVHLAWRDVDTGSDTDFHDIATDTLPALPGAGDTYNIQLEKVGNDLNVTVFQSKAVVAECSGTVPVAMQAEYGDNQFLLPRPVGQVVEPRRMDHRLHPELLVRVPPRAVGRHDRLHDERVAQAPGRLGRTRQLDGRMTAPDGFDADWSDGIHIVGYQRDFDGRVYLAGAGGEDGRCGPGGR